MQNKVKLQVQKTCAIISTYYRGLGHFAQIKTTANLIGKLHIAIQLSLNKQMYGYLFLSIVNRIYCKLFFSSNNHLVCTLKIISALLKNLFYHNWLQLRSIAIVMRK